MRLVGMKGEELMTGGGIDVGALRYCPLGDRPDGTSLRTRISERPGKGASAAEGDLSLTVYSMMISRSAKHQVTDIE
jgi:hypothetical protein